MHAILPKLIAAIVYYYAQVPYIPAYNEFIGGEVYTVLLACLDIHGTVLVD